MKILILGSDSQSFLTVVRSLGRAKHEIHVAWCEPTGAAAASRYIDKRHTLAQYVADNAVWLTAFQHLLDTNGIDLVIPCSDSVIIPLQAIQHRLQNKARLYVLPDDLYRIANSKNAMYRIAQELDIPLAKAATITSEADALTALDVLKGPWVFKPEFSYADSAPRTNNAVRKAFTRADALQLIPEFLTTGPFQIQENFIGRGAGVVVLCERGEILLEFQHVRIHEPLHGGGSSYRKGMPVHDGMREATQKIMARLQYTGVAMVEFKQNSVSGQWIFVELNPRFWGSLPLAVASGVDFPKALVDLLMHGTRPLVGTVRTDLYARNLTLDVDWMRSNLHADKQDPTLSALPVLTVLKEFLNIVRGKERWDTLAMDDMAPFFREVGNIVKKKTAALVRRITVSTIYLTAMRATRRRRLQLQLRGARNIAFVCYGNICRSPFAEIYARENIANVQFQSFGFHLPEKRPSPPIAITAAQSFNIDLSRHTSRCLSADDVREADILIVFDRRNLSQIHFSFPEAKSKTFLISDLANGQALEVADPYEYDLAFFVETYRCMRRYIDEMRSSVVSRKSESA